MSRDRLAVAIVIACLLATVLAFDGHPICKQLTPDNWFLWWWYGCGGDAAGGGAGGAG